MTRIYLAACFAAVTAVFAAGCSDGSDYVYVEPASVEKVGPDLWRVQLTPLAAERTGIETTEIVSDGDKLVIPYSAVMYHYDGTTWTYTSGEEFIYLRAPIEIDRIEGDRAILISGPPVGEMVVTVGAAELYGVEFGIGK